MSRTEQIIFNKSTYGLRLLLGQLSLICAIFLWCWPILPDADSSGYFNFADTRSFFGLSNAMDVLSNLAFLVIGIVGFIRINKTRTGFSKFIIYCGSILCLSSILTCFGSIYFHLNPSPATLFWDRLPMTIGFSTILALVAGDRIDEKVGFYVLSFLIPLGLLTVIGFQQGWSSLKPYIGLQFGSIAFIVLLISTIKENKIPVLYIWSAIGLYGVAKAFELGDSIVYDITGAISGHSLKHLFAALGIYKVLTIFKVNSK